MQLWEPPAKDRVARLLLAAALLLGLVRFVRLSEWSLWIDEALTWADAHHGIEGGEISNPIGYWLIQGTVRLLGGIPTEASLRILPAIAGWSSILVTYLAFRGAFGARRAAAASLLVAVSSWHLYWSQTARFYTLAQLVGLLGAWALLSGLLRGRTPLALVGLCVAAAGSLLHPSAALILPAFALLPVILQRARRPLSASSRRAAYILAGVAIVGALLGIGWVWRTWSNYANQKGQDSFDASLASIGHFAKTTGFFLTPLLGTAVLFGAWTALRTRRAPELFALGVVASGIVLALGMSALVRVSAQYVFVLFPWIALMAVLPLGTGVAGALGRRGELAYLALLALPSLVNQGLYLTVRRGERPAWREAFQHVANHRAEGDQIFGMEAPVGEFYLAPWNKDLRRPTALTWLEYFHALARVSEHWARKGRRAWYVVNPEQFAGWDPRDAEEFQRFLREECRLDKVWPLYVESRDLSVWVYRRD